MWYSSPGLSEGSFVPSSSCCPCYFSREALVSRTSPLVTPLVPSFRSLVRQLVGYNFVPVSRIVACYVACLIFLARCRSARGAHHVWCRFSCVTRWRTVSVCGSSWPVEVFVHDRCASRECHARDEWAHGADLHRPRGVAAMREQVCSLCSCENEAHNVAFRSFADDLAMADLKTMIMCGG